MIVATPEDLREFSSLWSQLAAEAAALSARLPEDQREGAETVRRVAERFAARELRPDTRPSALPLSRPFGEWHDVDGDTRATWDAIGRVETFWRARLGKGVFELR